MPVSRPPVSPPPIARILLLFVISFFSFQAAGQVIIWMGEAEDGTISGTAEVIEGCTYASGGQFVRMNADPGNELLISDVDAQRTGDHTLAIEYFYTGTCALEIFVNGVPTGKLDFPSATWCYQGPPALFSVTIPLNQGKNEIAFRTVGGTPGAFVDRLQVIDGQVVREPRSYYVSTSKGNDSNAGTGPDVPWKTLEKVANSTFIPGDSIRFMTGDEFGGQLTIQGSGAPGNPIVCAPYGEGDKPVVNGASATGGAYEAAVLISNQSFIELAGLEITNDRRSARPGQDNKVGYGIYVHNDGDSIMEHFHFHDLVIREVYAITTEGVEFNDLKVAGIYFRSERNKVPGKEKHIRDVLVDSCFITRTGKFGIWSQHAGGDPGIGNDSMNRNMNLVFRHNHIFETGGSGITPGRSYNCLVEHNTFECTGSDADLRMAKRGSGAWFFACRNVIAQYNTSLHVRGPADSYGMHIDYGNRNVILQFNYSEDSEGGFAEILGKNVNSVYRYNVSVNDGTRNNKGNSIWISTYAGTDTRVPSDSNYVYNNTIYVDRSITPDIYIEGKNSFVYNNIFCATGGGSIGNEMEAIISPGGKLVMSNNLFSGNVSTSFSDLDAAPVSGDPLFSDPSADDPAGFMLLPGSPAVNMGTTLQEPLFPMAGKGIFKNVNSTITEDMFGNSVDLSGTSPNIGSWNGDPLSSVSGLNQPWETDISLYPNPARNFIHLGLSCEYPRHARIEILDMKGDLVWREDRTLTPGRNNIRLQLPEDIKGGIYVVNIYKGGHVTSKPMVVASE